MKKTWFVVHGDAWVTFSHILGGAGLDAIYEEDIATGNMMVLDATAEVEMCAELANSCIPHEER